MRRDPARLASTPYDLLVVGGGIHGLMAAYDASLRGLRVALVERGDFGGGLSFNHQRTIHGGLRDVGAGRLRKARRQIRERRTWARIAPHLLRPLPFLVGTYGLGTRSRAALRLGFALYDRLGRGRNDDVPPELHLPAARLESAATILRLFRGVDARGLTGGAVWYDYQTLHPDRITWLVALAAEAAGARLVNYVEAIDAASDRGRVTGVHARDRVSGAEYEIRATATLVAAGSALGPLLDRFGTGGAPPLVRAMNLLLDREGRDIALVAPGASGRMLTLVPWRGRLLVGTAQSDDLVPPDAPAPGPEMVQAMLDDVNQAFPALGAGAADVLLVHHGLVPAAMDRGRANLIGEPVLIAHASKGRPGLYSLAGVKYTTARLAAESAVDVICRDLRRPARCRTARTPLPHAAIADVDGRLTDGLRAAGTRLDPDVFAHLASWYGTEAPALVSFSAERGLLDRIAPGSPVLAGEMAYAASEGSAVRLADAVLRRTMLGSAGHPGRIALERAAEVMAAVAGWRPDDVRREIADVDAVYPAGAATGG